MPTLDPVKGAYTRFQTVTVDPPTTEPTADMYYTLNGTPPTQSSSPIAAHGQIPIQGPATLMVIAVVNGMASAPRIAHYDITGQVSTSGNHTLILCANGTLWGTGKNDYGQLGDGTTTSQILFKQIQIPGLTDIVAVAAGGNHNLVSHALDASASPADSNRVLAWGSNTSGELGMNNLFSYAEPAEIPATPSVHPFFDPNLKPNVAAGLDFSLVLRENGTVVAAGQNTYGQLGNAQSISRSTTFIPINMNLPAGGTIAALAAGRWHGLAVTNTGAVRSWGYGGFGQLGNGLSPTQQFTAVPVSNLTNVSAVAEIGRASCRERVCLSV